MKLFRGLLLMCLLSCVFPAAGQLAGGGVPTIDVVGKAEAVLEPDYIEWVVDIKTRDQVPKIAIQVNKTLLTDLMKIASDAGVDHADIVTGRAMVEQKHGDGEDGWRDGLDYVETRVRRRVTLRMNDMDAFEKTLDQVHGLGVVYAVRYKSSKYDEAVKRVQREALNDARRLATDQAEAIGQRIGPAVSVEVSRKYNSGGYGGLFGSDDDQIEQDRSEAIEDGKIHVSAYAYVTFKLGE